ncbi:IgGFc-binding protein [Enhygromyxa salina]|uniref:IgGFc-binding protein N-terminal domain-containing protein n=1 Tax=Enhygromyxa salina TaxID=215803 RepID=A0A2S9YMJ0_9BACT|nr:IgGFc-binding protein [Enhygromyxa salina]PRQ06308.1 hypothetical protein ENSA7_39850 [Enhygromyxa salina]
MSISLAACTSSDGLAESDTGVGPTTIVPTTSDSTSGPDDGASGPDSGTTGDGDGDGDSGDGDDDPTGGGTGPKFDLMPVPDGSGDTGGGFMGIPEDCNTAAQVESAVGCLFFGLDLDNLSSGETSQYGIIVSNVQEDQVATAYVEQKVGGNWNMIAGPQAIQPLDSFPFFLPDNHQEGSGLKVGGTYRVTTDVPTVAYQFNPYDGNNSYTTDASLLYPVASWDYIYDIVGYHVTISYGSYINVVGAVDGTQLEVTVANPTVAGAGIPAGQPNVPFIIQLDEGDVAQIATEGANNSMTGTRLLTDEDHPVGVFTGTECTNTGQGACDHMEEMLTGLRLWGTQFVASRMPIRQVNDPEATIWQIYASEDDTTITIDASVEVTGLPPGPIVLDAGEKVEFPATGSIANPGDFFVDADKPIAVMSYLIGINSGDGDPAMVQMSPVEQYLPRYVVLVPATWVNDYLVITRLEGAQVEVDGVVVPDMEFIPVGNGDYEVARLLTPDGVHAVDGLGDPVSVTVVGFDSYDSYAYLGGVGTSVINPSPQG